MTLWARENEPDPLALEYKFVFVAHVGRDINVIDVNCEDNIA
jgi:hypothetical protein